MCVSFWYEAYSIIKLSSAGSFSELADFVFNCISPARVCSAFLPWFPRDTKACCGAENRETLGRGREKAPMGPWWMPALLPSYHLSPKGCSTSFALGKPLTNVCLKRLRGLENRKATSTLENPVGQLEPQFRVRMEGGAWPYSQNPNPTQQEAP